MAHVVVNKKTDKLLAGHDKKMTQEQAESRAAEANSKAEELGIEARYEAAEKDI